MSTVTLIASMVIGALLLLAMNRAADVFKSHTLSKTLKKAVKTTKKAVKSVSKKKKGK